MAKHSETKKLKTVFQKPQVTLNKESKMWLLIRLQSIKMKVIISTER